MNSWNEIYDNQIYNLNYENLTHKPSDEIKKLINYVGINWEENCLRPHKNFRSVNTASNYQIRKAIYKGSSKDWEKYKPYLNGIFDTLDNILF